MTRPLLALLLALLSVLVMATATVAQPDVRFDPPTARGAFGEDVTFSTTFSSDVPPTRVELLARLPDDESDRVTIAAVEPTPDGWRATVAQGGHIVPNTSWSYRFRVVTDEGDAVGPVAVHRVADTRFAWDVLQGDGVDVWTYEGDDGFARRALEIAERALASSSELLGVTDSEPVDFFVYTDTREFRQAMGPATRENIGGQAHPAIRTLFALIEPRQVRSDWVEEVITHELAHLVFHDAVDNPVQYPPRWLNEGVAVYLASGYSDGSRGQVEGAAGGGTIIPLEGLGGQFPTRPSRQSLAYAESIDALDHFLETHGEAGLVELMQSFRVGLGLDGAFRAVTGEDFAAFDTDWLASLGVEDPEPYGPQAGEPGPVPEAWQSTGDTAEE
jgi:hypothetical protein